MSDGLRLSSVTLNCQDAEPLANFYADITGGTITFCRGGWATVVTRGGRIDIQAVEGYERPQWPGASGTSLLHLDFLVDDLEDAEQRVVRAGAVTHVLRRGVLLVSESEPTDAARQGGGAPVERKEPTW